MGRNYVRGHPASRHLLSNYLSACGGAVLALVAVQTGIQRVYRQAQCLRRVAMDPGSLEWPG